MNKEKKNIIILILLLAFVTLIFLHNQEVKESIITGTELWLTKVFPSLFPMFILSELLIAFEFPELLAKLCSKTLQKLFHTTPYGAFAFFMSLLSGTPSSAYIIKKLVEEEKISNADASHLLSFTFFSNPFFLITMLTLIFPNHPKYIVSIIFIHYISNIFIGFLLRPENPPQKGNKIIFNKTGSLGSTLSSAIKNSMNTLLLILGTICFYLMLSCILKTSNENINLLFKGMLELTQGLNALPQQMFPINIKAYLAITFISFGGLSIHTQIQSIITDTKISYPMFLKGRILHVILSLFLLFIATNTGIVS